MNKRDTPFGITRTAGDLDNAVDKGDPTSRDS